MIWRFCGNTGQPQPLPGSGIAYVYFIDVGQGDCALIRSGETDILIDSGEYDRCTDVFRTLDSLGVKELDYAVISHPHSDHMGCMYRIIEEYGAGTVIIPEIPEQMIPVNVSYTELMAVIGRNDIPIIYAKAGTTVDLGEAGMLDIIAPVRTYEDLNNFSAVLRYRFGDAGFLFCGDIEKEAEQDIVSAGCDISADVIKVPHRGSGTSSTRAFVNAVSPRYAVFSAGQENDFGHPHANIVRLYESLGSEILRTDLNGTITFITDGHSINVNTEKERPMNSAHSLVFLSVTRRENYDRNARTSEAFVSGFTFGMTFVTMPFSSIMKVVRTTPIDTLP